MKLDEAIKIWKVCEGRTFIQINCSAKEREALRTVIEKAGKDKQQIIFEHYVKVREICYLNMLEDGHLDCEKCKLYGRCYVDNFSNCTDEEIRAFIEKVEGGE